MNDTVVPISATTPERRAVRLARSTRRLFGLADLAFAVAATAAIVVNIGDRIAQDTWDPSHFFHYFTIQTSILNIGVLAVGAMFGLLRSTDARWYTALRASTVAYGVVVGVVFNLLLASFPADGGYINHFPFTNDLEHAWVPIYLALEWLLRPRRDLLGWGVLWVCASYPLAWAVASLVRGLAGDGWYPYFFINVSKTGAIGVATYIAAIAVLMMGLCVATIGVQRLHARILGDAGRTTA